MADKSVVKHTLRLNLSNERHCKIQKILSDLDKDIHKSTNQFIINAMEFYIDSFENDDIIKSPIQKQQAEYLTKSELTEIRREIKDDVKDEMIRLLGSFVAGSSIVRVQESSRDNIQADDAEEDVAVSELANKWG